MLYQRNAVTQSIGLGRFLVCQKYNILVAANARVPVLQLLRIYALP